MIPARELLADMLLEANQNEEALAAYEADLLKQPNRFNGIYGAARAAQKLNNTAKANHYYKLLTTVASSNDANRRELAIARSSLSATQ